MVTPQTKLTMSSQSKQTSNNISSNNTHSLKNTWVLWGHLPHDIDWSMKSYNKIFTVSTVEEAIAITETLPPILVQNCMLFWMREGIKPTWEDPKNRNGGCFSYKVVNKTVFDCWKELTYSTLGNTISKQMNFVDKVTGFTISPKKNFCIIKIWMADCSNQNPAIVTNEIKGIVSQGCIFKKHAPEY